MPPSDSRTKFSIAIRAMIAPRNLSGAASPSKTGITQRTSGGPFPTRGPPTISRPSPWARPHASVQAGSPLIASPERPPPRGRRAHRITSHRGSGRGRIGSNSAHRASLLSAGLAHRVDHRLNVGVRDQFPAFPVQAHRVVSPRHARKRLIVRILYRLKQRPQRATDAIELSPICQKTPAPDRATDLRE